MASSAKAMGRDVNARRRRGKAIQVAKDLVAGTAGGIVQVLTAMPFDTIKVRMVCLPDVYTNGPMDCFRRTVANEGMLGLYKGTLSPLVGVGACVAIQFGVLEATKRALLDARIANGQSQRLSVGDMYIAGFVAGGANTVVSSPVEHIRIRMQVQTNAAGEAGMYKNTVDCARQVLRDYGVKGVYKGFSASLLRETFGYGLYFSAYEMTKRKMMELQGITDPTALSTPAVLVAGAAAGFGMWTPMYPIDAIKSKMQGDALSNSKYRTFVGTARQMLAKEGIGGFFKGFGPCMLRAAPVNAATFIGFEAFMKLLNAVVPAEEA